MLPASDLSRQPVTRTLQALMLVLIGPGPFLFGQEPDRSGLVFEELFCTRNDLDCVDDTLEVRFANGHSFLLEPGDGFEATVVTYTASEGVRGWSFGLSHDPEHLGLVPDSVRGGVSELATELAEPLFEFTRPARATELESPAGFTSAVVLSFARDATLPVGELHVLARARYELVGDLPLSGTLLRLSDRELAVDGSPPVTIEWSVDGEARRPRFLRHGVVGDGRVVDRCRSVGNDEDFCDGADNCIPEMLALRFGTKDGPRTHATLLDGDRVDAVVVLDTSTADIQGWSYGISHDPAILSLRPDSASLRDTDAEATLVAPFFDVTTAVEGGEDYPPGLISATVLSFSVPANLPTGQRNSLARAVYDVIGDLALGEHAFLRFEDNVLRNAPSPPVAINLTVAGNARIPSTLGHGAICSGIEIRSDFRRGDVDGNQRVDVADAVHIVRRLTGELVEPTAPTTCLDAYDADDDGRIAFTDAAALLRGIFARARLPEPSGNCGVDPSPDNLACLSRACP